MGPTAVIFDLDGTVLDNEDEYGLAFKKVLGGLGKRVDSKYPHTAGIGVKENWPLLLSKYKIKTKKSIEELARETQDMYLQLLPKVEIKKGLENFVSDLRNSGIMVALATSSVWRITDKVLTELGLEDFFDVTTTGEEVDYKKPDPGLFLLTAQKLEIEPEDCLVIEDSVAGIEAAHGAGMKAIGIARDKKHARTLEEAELVVSDFRQIKPAVLASL